MIIGVCQLTLRLHTTRSLKEKRSIIKGLLARLRNQINAGVAELDAHDIWGKAVIGLSTVSNSEAVIRGIFREAEQLVNHFPGIEIVDISVSLL
jgi:uncharacterized protein YlxP (DUF503 family)